jgi:hypothetical protein
MTASRRASPGARMVLALTLGACSQSLPTRPADCRFSPVPGLYQVDGRECENPLQETDFCPLTQYIEIAPSEMYGVPNGRYSLAFWYAEHRDSAEYSYEAHALRGRCVQPDQYRVEHDAEGTGTLTLRARVPVAYDFVSHTGGTPNRLVFRMHLSLRPVVRTPTLDRRLQIVHD